MICYPRAGAAELAQALIKADDLYAMEAEIRSSPADERLAVRKSGSVSLMQLLYDWVQQQMTTLSRHSDTAKAFAYRLTQQDALNLYRCNGRREAVNNIAENASRGVALGRKNWLFAASDRSGERAAVLCSLIGTCRLNGMDPEAFLHYVLSHIQHRAVNRLSDLLPWQPGM